MPLRRITMLTLLMLCLLALTTRLIVGERVPSSAATADPPPNTAYGSTTYVGRTDVFEGGILVWEFSDPSCTGYLRVLKFSLSGEAESLSQVLRQPNEAVAYWYNGTIYDEMERSNWLINFAVEKLWSLVHVENRLPPKSIYLKIFHPNGCVVPPTTDWTMLAAAIHS